jgi:hypothetical protein
LPFAAAIFDGVFEHMLLEHVPDPLAVLGELRQGYGTATQRTRSSVLRRSTSKYLAAETGSGY